MKREMNLKRLISLTILLAVCLFTNVYASNSIITTITLTGTQNLISLPCVPMLSNPSYIFNGYTIDDNLKTWIPGVQDYNIFDQYAPEYFGGILLGEGYWINANANDVISYESLPSGLPYDGIKTDTFLPLPGKDDGKNEGGIHLVGCPYDENVPIANIRFSDGIEMKSWSQAEIAGWVEPSLTYWNGSNYEDITLDGQSGVKTLQPGKAYWITTNIDSLAMIVIAPVHVSLQGTVILSNFTGDITTIPLTVEMNGTPYNLNLDAQGKFTILDVIAGTYDIRIKASHWLSKAKYGFEFSENTVMDAVTLINGDVVDNNDIDFSDINAVRAAYGSFPGDDNWNEQADVDGSGEVDFTDIGIIRNNYGEIGE